MVGGVTLLHYACAYQKPQLVEMLVVAGCEINATDDRGMTPLSAALLRKNQTIVDFLLSRGANPNVRDENERTALHHALQAGFDRATVAALIDAKANVNAPDTVGMTPLHMAAQSGRANVAELLLDKGALVNARTRDGLTAADLARGNLQSDVLDLLVSRQPEPTTAPVATTPVVTAPVTPVAPPPPSVVPKQVMLVIMQFSGNRVPGQRTLLMRNTRATPVKGELVCRTIDEGNQVLSGRRNLSFAPHEQHQVTIGIPMPIITNVVAGTTTTTTGYRPTPRYNIIQPNDSKMGFFVEFYVDGALNNSQSQPPDAVRRIRAVSHD